MGIDLSGHSAAAAIAAAEKIVDHLHPLSKEQRDQVRGDPEKLKLMLERAHVVGIVARHLLTAFEK